MTATAVIRSVEDRTPACELVPRLPACRLVPGSAVLAPRAVRLAAPSTIPARR